MPNQLQLDEYYSILPNEQKMHYYQHLSELGSIKNTELLCFSRKKFNTYKLTPSIKWNVGGGLTIWTREIVHFYISGIVLLNLVFLDKSLNFYLF